MAATAPRTRLPGLPQRKVIRVATRCADAEHFVDTFWRMCEERSCFVPTKTMRPEGLEAVFALQLADGQPLLRGVGVVLSAWDDDVNPYGRSGLLIGFRRLTADSRALVRRMCARRETWKRGHSDTIPQPLPVANEGATPDLAVDEPPRAAIQTILGVAPLPRARNVTAPPVVAASARPTVPTYPILPLRRSPGAEDPADPAWPPDVRRMARGTAHPDGTRDTERMPRERVSRRYEPNLWMIATFVFALAFLLARLT